MPSFKKTSAKNVLAVLLLAALGLAGCASTMGNESVSKVTAADVKQKIIVGKSTKKDVEQQFGKPGTVQSSKNGDTWIYQYGQAKSDAVSFIPVVGMFMGGIDATSKTVTVEFAKNGVVRDATYGESTERLR